MKKSIAVLAIGLILAACGQSKTNTTTEQDDNAIADEIITTIESERDSLNKETETTLEEIDSLLNSI